MAVMLQLAGDVTRGPMAVLSLAGIEKTKKVIIVSL